MKLALIASAAALSSTAFAIRPPAPLPHAVVVECTANVKGRPHSALIRINHMLEIVAFSKTALVKANPNSIFGYLGQNREETGIEYVNSFRAPNGFALLQAGTTADEITIGVSPDLTKGFYAYRDGGSGNGHSRFPMACRQVPVR